MNIALLFLLSGEFREVRSFPQFLFLVQMFLLGPFGSVAPFGFQALPPFFDVLGNNELNGTPWTAIRCK